MGWVGSRTDAVYGGHAVYGLVRPHCAILARLRRSLGVKTQDLQRVTTSRVLMAMERQRRNKSLEAGALEMAMAAIVGKAGAKLGLRHAVHSNSEAEVLLQHSERGGDDNRHRLAMDISYSCYGLNLINKRAAQHLIDLSGSKAES